MLRKKQRGLEQDDEPRVKMEPGVQQQQQQHSEAQGVWGGEGVVEALVVSNSRLCAQVGVSDTRAFTELEHARVLELQLTEVRVESKAQASVFQAEIRAKNGDIRARDVAMQAKDAEFLRLRADSAGLPAGIRAKDVEITRLQTELARRDAQPAAVTLSQLQQHVECLLQLLRGQVVGGGGGGCCW